MIRTWRIRLLVARFTTGRFFVEQEVTAKAVGCDLYDLIYGLAMANMWTNA